MCEEDTQNLQKDIDRLYLSEIHARLFDHRPIIQAEIRYFVKEFEEKRGFREKKGLENMNNLIVELNDQTLPKTHEPLSSNIQSILARLEAAGRITSRIQQREQEADQVLRATDPQKSVPAWDMSWFPALFSEMLPDMPSISAFSVFICDFQHPQYFALE
uniref:biogenesis of lysosome-related organelles complex 1 subunit 5 isoform X2 n=1 Tax=Pristiophorus japonicus TaxID=55135 RepID=UPI00398E85C6